MFCPSCLDTELIILLVYWLGNVSILEPMLILHLKECKMAKPITFLCDDERGCHCLIWIPDGSFTFISSLALFLMCNFWSWCSIYISPPRYFGLVVEHSCHMNRLNHWINQNSYYVYFPCIPLTRKSDAAFVTYELIGYQFVWVNPF